MIYFARIEVCTLLNASFAKPWPINLIKIGQTTADPKVRAAQVQTMIGRPVMLLAVIPGGPRKEDELHRRFSDLRITGAGNVPEWFYPAKRLMDFIGGLPKYQPKPDMSRRDIPWEWIDDQIRTRSITSVALDLGMTPSALYMRIYRRRTQNALPS